MKEKKFLLITQKFPYPPMDGGMVATSNFIDCLKELGEVYLFAPQSDKHPIIKEPPQSYVAKYETYELSILNKSKASYIKGLFCPLQAIQYYNKNGALKLAQFIKEIQPNFVILDSIYLAYLVKKANSSTKYYLRTHNIEYEYWDGFIQKMRPSFIDQVKLKYYSKLVKRYEIKIWRNATKILHINPHEVAKIKATVNHNNIYYIPFVVSKTILDETQYFRHKNKLTLYYIGTFDWAPNLHGMEYFLKNMWDEIVNNFPEVTLIISGKKIEILKNAIKGQILRNIQFVDTVQDPLVILKNADILVSPVYFGTGISVKVLEALASKKCVITTPQGARGLSLSKEEGLGIFNNTKEFLDILKYYSKPEIREKIGEKARNYIINNHTKEKVVPLLASIFGN